MVFTASEHIHSRCAASARQPSGQTDYLRIVGHVLQPSITRSFTSTTRIADVGTGTGILLLELASIAPASVHLDGYDISSAHFPPPGSYPRNVSFHIQDARIRFPLALRGVYDVVHLRLLAAGMREDDWQRVAVNALELLKPGGAIQWVEADHSNMFEVPFKGLPSSTTQALTYWGTRILELAVGDRVRFGWSTLPSILERLGVERITGEVFSSDRCPEARSTGTDVQIGVCGSMAVLPQVFTSLGGGKAVCDMYTQMNKDRLSGAYVRWDVHVLIGYKGS